jgi:hypothetical protein
VTELRALDTEQLELTREFELRIGNALRIPSVEPLFRDTLQITVNDRSDVRGGRARPYELRARNWP